MKGLIGMACGETARFSEPYDSLMNLARPAGWSFLQARSMSIAENWNAIAEVFLKDLEAEWLFLVNDDHVYPQDTLLRLLAHDRDIVTALYVGRQQFEPIIGDHVSEAGEIHPRYLSTGDRGLQQVKSCGDGALLLRRSVLEAIPAPRWTLGTYDAAACDHDTAFSVKVRVAGFTIWCDLETVVHHLGVFSIAPHRNDRGEWSTAILTGAHVLRAPAMASPLALVR